MFNCNELRGKKVIVKIDDKKYKGKIKSGFNITVFKTGHLWWKRSIMVTQELLNNIVKIFE